MKCSGDACLTCILPLGVKTQTRYCSSPDLMPSVLVTTLCDLLWKLKLARQLYWIGWFRLRLPPGSTEQLVGLGGRQTVPGEFGHNRGVSMKPPREKTRDFRLYTVEKIENTLYSHSDWLFSTPHHSDSPCLFFCFFFVIESFIYSKLYHFS